MALRVERLRRALGAVVLSGVTLVQLAQLLAHLLIARVDCIHSEVTQQPAGISLDAWVAMTLSAQAAH